MKYVRTKNSIREIINDYGNCCSVKSNHRKTIGGFTISTSKIYKTKTTYSDSNSGVYIGTDGIGLGAGTITNLGKCLKEISLASRV